MTAIKLHLNDVHGGWEHASIPDDLAITLKTGCTTHWMTASLRELVQLYYYSYNREECYLGIGTGKSIEIVSQADHIRLKKPPLDIVTTFEDLQRELEGVLVEIFEYKDRKGDQKARNEALESIQQSLEELNESFDVRHLYDRLMSN